MTTYRTKLIKKTLDCIISDVNMDITQHLETLVTKLIESEQNRKVIEEYLAEGI